MKNRIPVVLVLIFFLMSSLVQGATVLAHYTFDDSANMTSDDSGNGHTLAVYTGYGTPGYSNQGKSGGTSVFDGATQGWIINNNIYPAGSFGYLATHRHDL